jgi:hypothetical protein
MISMFIENVQTPLWHFRTGTCSVLPFSSFRLKSIHNVRKPQKSNSYRTIDANYAESLVSLAIKSHFTGSVRWYEDRISFPNLFWDGKREINLQNITYGCRIYLSWKFFFEGGHFPATCIFLLFHHLCRGALFNFDMRSQVLTLCVRFIVSQDHLE